MRFVLYIILLVTTSVLYSQEEDRNKRLSFFSNSEFKWEKWEYKCSDSLKIKIISKIKRDFSDDSIERHTTYMRYDPNFFHIIDVNSDGKLDVVYNGFAGSEKNSILLFINENGVFVERINTYGRIIGINKESSYLPMTFKIMDYPCCEDTVYGFEQYNYYIENNRIYYKISIKIKFFDKTVFPILTNDNYIEFETTSEEYNLRSAPEIINEVENNVVSVYPKGSLGTAIYSEKEKENDRVWWFVIMRNNKKVLQTNLYEENNRNYYSIGWMSSKLLKKRK